MIDIKEIKKMIALLEESDIDEIEVTSKETTIRVARHANRIHQSTSAPAQDQATHQSPPPSQGTTSQKSANYSEASIVRSPMVGTFYLAPSPDAPPFIKVGDKVNKGDQICIIEAMKMMNAIDAKQGGTVKEIFVENGEPVQFDQPLVAIED